MWSKGDEARQHAATAVAFFAAPMLARSLAVLGSLAAFRTVFVFAALFELEAKEMEKRKRRSRRSERRFFYF